MNDDELLMLCQEDPERVLMALLSEVIQNPFASLPLDTRFSVSDDEEHGLLEVSRSQDGDMHLTVRLEGQSRPSRSLRLRMPGLGGGEKPLVHRALVFLALAIKAQTE